jgi:murein DD-endopeptidase MepM/ murein hydrolase activator NlpD
LAAQIRVSSAALHKLLVVAVAAGLCALLPVAAFADTDAISFAPARAERVLSDDPLRDQTLVAFRDFHALWPTRGLITTYFGELGPLSPRGHSGLDIAGPWGAPVLAADEGQILKAYWNDEGYGGLVIVAHPSGYETWYGHLSSFKVEPGQNVKRGEQIGSLGSTGYSTGPHLHFEVRENGQICDPLNFLLQSALQDADW